MESHAKVGDGGTPDVQRFTIIGRVLILDLPHLRGPKGFGTAPFLARARFLFKAGLNNLCYSKIGNLEGASSS
jgi:hypothetical protein